MKLWSTNGLVACIGMIITLALGSGFTLALADEVAPAQLVNPGFELGEGLPGWVFQSGGPQDIQVVPTARTGQFGVRIADTSSDRTVGLHSEPVPIMPDATYAATAWAQVESGTAQLYLEFWDAAGTRVDVVFTGVTAKGQWQPIHLERKAPPNSVTATVLLYGHRTNVGVAIFDDVELARVDERQAAGLLSLPEAQVLAPNRFEWPDRPSAADRIAHGFAVRESGHPRLVVTQAELPNLQAKAASTNAFGVDFQRLISQLQSSANQHRLQKDFTLSYYAGHQVTFPLPPKQPDYIPNPPAYVAGRYPFWTAMGSHLRSRLQTLAGAYLFTGDPRFAEAAKQDLLALAEWDVWSDPTYNCGGQTCLDTGYIVEGVSFAYDVIYDLLTPDERHVIQHALVEKGLKPLFADTAAKVDHNIHMVRTAALGLGALLLLGDEPGMERYLARAYENFFWYLDQRLDSGATEGMLYTSVSMDHIAAFADALERVTGDRSMFEHPYVRDVLPFWILYGYGPKASGLVNLSDSSLAHYFANTMIAIGRVNELAQANWYIANSGAGGDLDRLLRLDPTVAIAPPSDWPTGRVFADIGWAYTRTGWQGHDTLLAFVSSGARMGHNHYDQNHFVLNVGGEWLIKDNGYQDYNPGPKNDMTNHTLGHNALLVNGQGQTIKGGGAIRATALSSVLDYVAGDASAAYAGTGISGWIRHVLHLKPDYFVLLDEIWLRSPADQPALLLHPSGQVTAGGMPMSAGFSGDIKTFDIRRGSVGVAGHLLTPQAHRAQMRITPGAEEYGPYLMIEPEVNGQRVIVATLLDPYSAEQLQRFDGDYRATSMTVLDSGLTSVLRTQDGLLFRAEGLDDRLALQFSVPVGGHYHVGVDFATAPTYGAVRVQIDDIPVGTRIDTYTPRLGETGVIEVGELELAAGLHTLTLISQERHAASRGHFVSLIRLQLSPVGAVAGPSIQPPAGWTALASGRHVSAADMNEHRLRFETFTPEGRDFVWLGLGPALDASHGAGIWTDGAHGWIALDHAGATQRLALVGGRTLALDHEVLVEADDAVNVAVERLPNGSWHVEAVASQAGTVQLRLPGQCVWATDASGMAWQLNKQDGMFALPASPGESWFVVETCQ